ncbi:MAG: 5-oxoprolinase subunit PxpB [Planctomycetes bacterium]|nr:5-oxoprolinase subunit PxpB [Planctomycetota bacterium]
MRLALGEAGSPQTQDRVRRATAALEAAGLPGLVGVTPAYATILLEFDLNGLNAERSVVAVRRALSASVEQRAETQTRIVEIPVCYEGPCAPDAPEVARMHGIGLPTLARLHAAPTYRVAFIGFAPGFGYLSGLPPQIATPRLPSPRVRVPVGSVAIAGEQTGIYATPGAGGWRLIGRTPLVMFDARRTPPARLAAGDLVRFMPISLAEFEAQMRGRAVDG